MSSGCGCEVYKFPHTPFVSALFCSSIPTFCSFKKMFFLFFIIYKLLYVQASRCDNAHTQVGCTRQQFNFHLAIKFSQLIIILSSSLYYII